ncbi:MAG: dihydrofolate reductase [Ruminiclostridium sp.]
MKIIVAADNKWGIGKDNNLLARLPADMKRFREITTGNTIVMGSKTYMSFPKRPLPDRVNLVITSKPSLYPEVRCFESVDAFLVFAKECKEEIYVCGGGMVYKELLPYCEKAVVTRVLHDFEADTFFPNLDEDKDWEIAERSEITETNGFNIQFVDYVNRNVKSI